MRPLGAQCSQILSFRRQFRNYTKLKKVNFLSDYDAVQFGRNLQTVQGG